MGCCSTGSNYVFNTFGNAADAVDMLGQGPLVEDIALNCLVAGGPVYGVKLAATITGTSSAVVASPVTTATGTITVSGAAYDSYDVVVEITGAGTVGIGSFRYSLDGRNTYSPSVLIPLTGPYIVANTNLTITFVPGAGPIFYAVGDLHSFTTTGPSFSVTELALGIAAVKAANVRLASINISGKFATGAGAATMAAALATHAASLFQVYQPVRCILDGGAENESTTQLAFVAFASDRVAVGYGDERVSSGKPFAGWGFPRCSVQRSMSVRCAAISVSTDPARFATGALPGVISITHDEFRTENMDAKKFATLRTHQGQPGIYICKVRLMSAGGSDYTDWQLGRVMDAACNVTYDALLPFLSSSVRTNADKTMNASDADRWEKKVNDALKAVLLAPDNAEGTPGHVSAAKYFVDRAYNVLDTKTVKGRVAIRPLGYADFITVELSFSANV
jgi:hypothetical protein